MTMNNLDNDVLTSFCEYVRSKGWNYTLSEGRGLTLSLEKLPKNSPDKSIAGKVRKFEFLSYNMSHFVELLRQVPSFRMLFHVWGLEKIEGLHWFSAEVKIYLDFEHESLSPFDPLYELLHKDEGEINKYAGTDEFSGYDYSFVLYDFYFDTVLDSTSCGNFDCINVTIASNGKACRISEWIKKEDDRYVLLQDAPSHIEQYEMEKLSELFPEGRNDQDWVNVPMNAILEAVKNQIELSYKNHK